MLLFGHSNKKTEPQSNEAQPLSVLHFSPNLQQQAVIADLISQSAKHTLQQKRNITLCEASTIEEVVSLCRGSKVGLLLLSLEPRQSLLDLLYTIRAASNNLPIVVIADSYGSADVNIAFNAGVQDVLVVGEFSANGLARALQYAFERSQSVAKMEQLQLRARRNNGVKNELIYRIAHEVRKTLDHVISLTDKNNSDQTTSSQPLGLLREQTLALSTVISAALDYTQLDSGQAKANPIRFHAQHYLQHLLKLLAERANSRGHVALAYFNNEWPVFLIADADKIWRIIVASFETILKLAKPGRAIVLSSTFVTNKDSTESIRISLLLSQSEVEGDQLNAIFESINQNDLSVVRKHGTTGLNLGIASALTKVINGRLWFEFRPGKGLIFYLEAPVER